MNEEELFAWIEDVMRPALERRLIFRSRRMLSRDDVHDLVQETLLRFVAHRPIGGELQLRAWLYTVADRIFADWARQRRRRPTVELIEEVPDDPKELDVLLKKAFDGAVSKLSESQQTALYLVAIGKTHPEIAEELMISVSNASFLVRQAKKVLKKNPKLSSIFKESEDQ